MIIEFIKKYEKCVDTLRIKLQEKHPESYKDLVTMVVSLLDNGEWESPDCTRIQEVNFGYREGTRLFIVPNNEQIPDRFWSIKIRYGSCSVCDTFLNIRERSYDDDLPTEQQIHDYLTLCLHIVQSIKEM